MDQRESVLFRAIEDAAGVYGEYGEAATSPVNAVDRIVTAIQALKPQVRWFYSGDLTFIEAAAQGTEPPRGAWAKRADLLIALTSRLGLARATILLATLLLTIGLYLRRRRAPQSGKIPLGAIPFAGFGALREPALARFLEADMGSPVVMLHDWGSIPFWHYRKPGLFSLLREWGAIWREIWPHLDRSIVAEFKIGYALAHVLIHFGRYCYYRTWLRGYARETGVTIMAASSCDDAAFAGTAVGMQVIYLTHGFQCARLVYPDFRRIVAFNGLEVPHFQRRVPGAEITLVVPRLNPINTERLAVLTGDYMGEMERSELCRSFIEWARQRHMPVIVRPHPRDETGYWNRWKGVAGITFDDTPSDFDAFLERHRPRFLVTWHSTTLLDALLRGVVPITLVQDREFEADTIFPISEIALRWPDAQETISQFSDHPEAAYEYALAKTDLVSSSKDLN